MATTERIVLDLVVVLLAAKLGGEFLRRLGQPALVGEILAGLLLGPSLFHVLPSFDQAAAGSESTVLSFFAELGILLLLFEVGLETDVKSFRRTGASAALVGTYGVVFSLVLGAAASWLLATRTAWVATAAATARPELLHIFVGATLTATSVGITARVLTELKTLRSPESQIILGAAVFDDVLGLIVLAIVNAFATATALGPLGIAKIFILALGFFVLAIAAGAWIGPWFMRGVDRLFGAEYVHLAFAVLFMLTVSYLATLAGLAPIVGAFAAGLALNGSEHRHMVFNHVRPLGSLFVSFFFVILGARIDLHGLGGGTTGIVLVAAALLTAVGILGKLAAGWGVVRIQASRLVVGVGMVPRGEVGLIFALYGLDNGLLANWQYTCLILVILLTTLVTPGWLKALRGRFTARTEPAPPSEARLASAVQP